MSLSIQTISSGDTSTISCTGEIDVSNADELRSAIHTQMEEGKGVRVDMSEVSYIDSTGIGVLIGAAHAASSFAVVAPQRNVARVFDMLGVTTELNVVSR